MNYFDHHIGDYRKDTGHLSLLEHGVYRQLLDTYYMDEKPLTTDHAKLMRSHCVRTADEKQALENVLNDFFVRTDEGYMHKRCDVVIEEYRAKSAKAGESAKARWDRVRAEKEKKAEIDANAMRTHSECNANHKPVTSNQEPVAINHKPESNSNPLVEQKQLDPSVEIFAYWQKVMKSPRSVLDTNRKGLIAKALKNYSPADICKAIRGCSKSPYHMGDNQQKTAYNGLNLILRDAEHIDRFIALDSGGARPASETVEQTNARVMAEFLGSTENDERTIEMEL